MLFLYSVIIPVCSSWYVIFFACVISTSELFYLFLEFLIVYFSLVVSDGTVFWVVLHVVCSFLFVSSYESTLGYGVV